MNYMELLILVLCLEIYWRVHDPEMPYSKWLSLIVAAVVVVNTVSVLLDGAHWLYQHFH